MGTRNSLLLTIAVWMFCLPDAGVCYVQQVTSLARQGSTNVTQVIVVFKTHFDIGYTDLADNGYCAEKNLELLDSEKEPGKRIDAYIATGRQKHGERPMPCQPGPLPKGATKVDRMRRKLKTKVGAAIYAARKGIVEPVFGQIKQARGFRQFLLRGLQKVQGEWALVCLGHNILKLYRICYE